MRDGRHWRLKMIVSIDALEITDWNSFHDVFARVFGFPDFYGCNMNAWIDCMTDLDDSEDTMTSVHVQPGELLTIHLEYADDFRKRCPDMFEALVDCMESVNRRRVNHTSPQPAILALMLEA
jgi:RNAse (barnase) inhibitor barstar